MLQRSDDDRLRLVIEAAERPDTSARRSFAVLTLTSADAVWPWWPASPDREVVHGSAVLGCEV